MINPNSFDIFDTLIARRCIEPHNIFRAVEEKGDFPNFYKLRVQAETDVATSEYTLTDIYARLQVICGIDGALTEKLKSLEISEEIDNVIPIAQNISRINDGDMLISDMYLPREVIGKMLKRAGCDRHTPMVLTSHGKS